MPDLAHGSRASASVRAESRSLSLGPRFLGRRPLLAFAAALPLALVTGCGDQDANAGSDSGADDGSGWTFTAKTTDTAKSRGRTVKLDARPDRLVVDHYSAAALWAYGIRPDGVFGYRFSDERTLRMDPDEARRMAVVGTDAELDLEALLSVDPDLIVGFGNQDGTAWAWWDEKVAEQVEEIAPFLGIRFGSGRHPGDIIEEYRALAGALGGDPDGRRVSKAKQTFESRLDRLRELAGRQPALRILPLHGESEIWVGHRVLGQVALLEDIGFRMVGPGSDDEAFTEISWETIADHPADVLMIYAGTQQVLRDNPAYARLPAVEADQVVEWDDKRPYTYASYNEWLADLIQVLEKAERLG